MLLNEASSGFTLKDIQFHPDIKSIERSTVPSGQSDSSHTNEPSKHSTPPPSPPHSPHSSIAVSAKQTPVQSASGPTTKQSLFNGLMNPNSRGF
jgi:hypothetical protein